MSLKRMHASRVGASRSAHAFLKSFIFHTSTMRQRYVHGAEAEFYNKIIPADISVNKS